MDLVILVVGKVLHRQQAAMEIKVSDFAGKGEGGSGHGEDSDLSRQAAVGAGSGKAHVHQRSRLNVLEGRGSLPVADAGFRIDGEAHRNGVERVTQREFLVFGVDEDDLTIGVRGKLSAPSLRLWRRSATRFSSVISGVPSASNLPGVKSDAPTTTDTLAPSPRRNSRTCAAPSGREGSATSSTMSGITSRNGRQGHLWKAGRIVMLTMSSRPAEPFPPMGSILISSAMSDKRQRPCGQYPQTYPRARAYRAYRAFTCPAARSPARGPVDHR